MAVAHCPSSNFYVLSGICAVRRLLNKDIKVGLGSDISGGPCPNMLDAFRLAIIASKVPPSPSYRSFIFLGMIIILCLIKMINAKQPELAPLTVGEAFYLLTLGGARALNIDHKVGNFMVGKVLLFPGADDASPSWNDVDWSPVGVRCPGGRSVRGRVAHRRVR